MDALITLAGKNTEFADTMVLLEAHREKKNILAWAAVNEHDVCKGFVFGIPSYLEVPYVGRDLKDNDAKGVGKELLDRLERSARGVGYSGMQRYGATQTLRNYYKELGFVMSPDDASGNTLIKA